MANKILVLSSDTLLGLASGECLVQRMREAVVATQTKAINVPPREHLEGEQSTLLIMPCVGMSLFGVKLVSVTPQNTSIGKPATQGTMILVDTQSGSTLAILDAAALTCQRTGAVAAMAVSELCRPDLPALGIVGCGTQGVWAAIQSSAIRPLSRFYCFDTSDAGFERFSSTVSKFTPHISIERCGTINELVSKAYCIVTATTAKDPVLPDVPELLGGRTFISIGSYRPNMQELPDSVYSLASEIVVDSPHAISEVGDVLNPIAKGLVRREAVIGIERLLNGTYKVEPGATLVFKSVGYAAYDLFAAQLFYDIAREKELGQYVQL